MLEKRAIDEMKKCERKLQGILGEAAIAGDYEALARLAEWAKALASMTSGAESSVDASSLSKAPQVLPKAASAPKGKKNAYPCFYRKGEELIKVGWSKKEKKEYWHKVPRKAVDLLASSVQAVGERGKMFAADKLLPLVDPADGSSIPDYQTYLVLAWFRNIGVVEQVGRQGYRLADGKSPGATAGVAWGGLGEWKG